MNRLLLLTFLLLLTGNGLQAQTIIYVNHAATGNADGTSWADAYTDFDDAVYSVFGHSEIWVAQGTYQPGSTLGTVFSRDSAEAYGGFNGTETSRSQRDWRNNETILDGDLGNPGDPMDNASTVVRLKSSTGTVSGIVLDGFTVQNGTAGGTLNSQTGSGGGIAIYDGCTGATIRNCKITHNMAVSGAGIWCYAVGQNAHVRIENCVLSENSAMTIGGALDFVAKSGAELTIEVVGCLFDNNNVGNGGTGPAGRLLTWLNGATLDVNFINCTFAQQVQPGISGIFQVGSLVNPGESSSERFSFHNCILWGNTGDDFDTYSGWGDPDSVGLYNCIANNINQPNYVSLNNHSTADPMYVLNGSDYHVQSGSPAIDAGVATGISSLLPDQDLDGNIRISGTSIDIGAYEAQTAVSTLMPDTDSWNLYPNPARDYVILETSSPAGNSIPVNILDLNGRVLKQYDMNAGEGHIRIDLTDVPIGVYLIRTVEGDTVIMKKLIRL